MSHIKPLDNLRGYAAILVLFWHGIPETLLLNYFDNGAIGVTLFFVLSGFLITKILLQSKLEIDANTSDRITALKRFYFRRSLRIFPIYYLTIVVLLLLNHRLSLEFGFSELCYSLVYLTNFYIYKIQVWPLATIHFWTLAIEEQFYIIWPLLIFMIPRKWLFTTILLLIGTGITSSLLTMKNDFGFMITTSCFDALGFGAVYAWFTIYKPHKLGQLRKIVTTLAIASLLTFCYFNFNGIEYFPVRCLIAILAFCLIIWVVEKQHSTNKLFDILFRNKAGQFTGRISYGVYLYHIPVYYLCNEYLLPLAQPFLPGSSAGIYIFFLIKTTPVILVAWLSWTWIEKPILRLKNKFADSPQPLTTAASVKLHVKETLPANFPH